MYIFPRLFRRTRVSSSEKRTIKCTVGTYSRYIVVGGDSPENYNNI